MSQSLLQVPGVRGNVHTGATPPWLRDEEEEDHPKDSYIGPSLDDFILHSKHCNIYVCVMEFIIVVTPYLFPLHPPPLYAHLADLHQH